jgi:hypothetical protein
MSLTVAAMTAMPVPHHGQAVRDVVLNPDVQTYKVDIVGAMNLTTTIQLPDDFSPDNVTCAGCVSPEEMRSNGQTSAGAAAVPQGGRNWAINVRSEERNIHLHPLNKPGPDNPMNRFNANVYIRLNGGRAVNLMLRLWDPGDAMSGAISPDADANVILRLTEDATFSGKMRQARKALEKKHADDVAQKARDLMFETLAGAVRCQNVSWDRPHRADKTVVRVRQVCRAMGQNPTYWVLFEVTNRSDVPLMLKEATFEPELSGFAGQPLHTYWSQPTLAYDESTRAIAIYTLKTDTEAAQGEAAEAAPSPRGGLPEVFRLRIVPESDDRQPIVIEKLAAR